MCYCAQTPPVRPRTPTVTGDHQESLIVSRTLVEPSCFSDAWGLLRSERMKDPAVLPSLLLPQDRVPHRSELQRHTPPYWRQSNIRPHGWLTPPTPYIGMPNPSCAAHTGGRVGTIAQPMQRISVLEHQEANVPDMEDVPHAFSPEYHGTRAHVCGGPRSGATGFLLHGEATESFFYLGPHAHPQHGDNTEHAARCTRTSTVAHARAMDIVSMYLSCGQAGSEAPGTYRAALAPSCRRCRSVQHAARLCCCCGVHQCTDRPSESLVIAFLAALLPRINSKLEIRGRT